MYTCGPTIYNVAHIGNLRTFLFEDVLRRSLKLAGLRVTQIMNLTDVDDKTIRGAAEEGLSLGDFTEKYATGFFRDLSTLGIEPAEEYPRATAHVPEMIALIEKLGERGHTYESEGTVWFRIATYPDYGKLSQIDLTQMRRGDRVADDEYEKEDVKDFALWKAAKPGEPTWDSPWSAGRPGWHIECSAMSMKYLGAHFDIHTGAVDNIFPHHENEIAQSEGATGEKFVDLWVHSEHLIVDGEKMSKSKGNFFTLRDLMTRGYRPRPIRYLLLSAHYRKQLNFTFEGLTQAGAALCRLDDLADRLGRETLADGALHLAPAAARAGEEMLAALDSDLNTAAALAPLFDLVREAHAALDAGSARKGDALAVRATLSIFERVFGICLGSEATVESDVEELVRMRQAARAARDWKEADRIRDLLACRGLVVEDTPQGVRLKKRDA
jgi:cysteinyl-tRNA synthetase